MSETSAPTGREDRRCTRPTVRTRARWIAVIPVALLVASCGFISFDEGAPADVERTDSVAVAAQESDALAGAVTIPPVGQAPSNAVPTPWESRITTSEETTTVETTPTAPANPNTLTFSSLAPVTDPTVADATSVASPPPNCYTSGACSAAATAQAAGGTVEIVNEAGSDVTVAVYTPAGGTPAALALARVNKPTVACTGSYCLVQGESSGLFFGNFIKIASNVPAAVSGVASSPTALTLVANGTPTASGTYRFDGYGAILDDAPIAARTWTVTGGELSATGCGQPYLYQTPPAAKDTLTGPCSGTPQIHGYGKASANPFVSLSGFVTPSGNIFCGLIPGGKLTCTAKQHSISVPKCTDKSVTDYKMEGLRVRVGDSGKVSKDNCLGFDLVGIPETKISYDRLAVGGGYVCEVQMDGVTCTAPSGHGFSLARASLDTF